MLKPRFYYSEPMKIGSVIAALDDNNNVLGTFNDKPLTINCKASRITICGIWDDENNVISFGVSRCSGKDQFRKDVGRNLAYNRALTDPCCTIPVFNGEVALTFMTSVEQIEKAVYDQKYPIKLDKTLFHV